MWFRLIEKTNEGNYMYQISYPSDELFRKQKGIQLTPPLPTPQVFVKRFSSSRLLGLISSYSIIFQDTPTF